MTVSSYESKGLINLFELEVTSDSEFLWTNRVYTFKT